jgi:hypothetical protein
MGLDEVRALHGIASLTGRKLTRNPKTGAVEAFNLLDILPFALNFIFPGMGIAAQIALGAAAGAGSAAIEGNDPLTGGLMGGALSGLGGSLFGGGADAAAAGVGDAFNAQASVAQNAAQQAAQQAATQTAGQGFASLAGGTPEALAGGLSGVGQGVGAFSSAADLTAKAAAEEAAKAALQPKYLTDIFGQGSDEFAGGLFKKANLPYTLAGGAALASLIPPPGFEGPPEDEPFKPAKPSAPRRFTAAPTGYLPGTDPEWSYFSPNPGPYFQGDPNYSGYAGGGHVGPNAPIDTNKEYDGVEPMGVDIDQLLRELDARARARATPEAQAQDATDEARRRALWLEGEQLMDRVSAQEAQPVHRWTGKPGVPDPVSGPPWSDGAPSNTVRMPIDMPRIMQMLATQQQAAPQQAPSFVQGGAGMPWGPGPEMGQQRMAAMPAQAPVADDQERFYQDKINMMHAERKKWQRNPVDRQKYDWYVNMRDLERAKKGGRQVSPRFDPSQTVGLDQSRYADGGIVGYAKGGKAWGNDTMSAPVPSGAWWRGEGGAMPSPTTQASGKHAAFGPFLGEMLQGRMPGGRHGTGQDVIPAQVQPTPYALTPRPPGSYLAGNALVEAPSIEPTLFRPVTGMAKGGGIGCYSHGGKAQILQQLLGRHIQGQGNGMDDDVPAMIDGREPAALSSGEFVVPSDAVSMLGDGNSDAGVKRLEDMLTRIRMMKTGKAKQAPRINPKRVMPA